MNRRSLFLWFLCEIALFLWIIFQKQLFVFNQYQIRIYLYGAIGVYLILALSLMHISPKQMGITKTNLVPSLLHAILPTAIFGSILIIICSLWPSLLEFTTRYDAPIQVFHRFFTYFIISVPMQECIFRGYVTVRLEQLTKNRQVILLVSSFIFAVAHIPFGSWLLSFATFFLGLILEENYLRFRTLATPILMHLVIGMLYLSFLIL